jgi:hypothetical protein
VRFQPRQRVYFKSLTSDHVYRGVVIRSLKDGFYLVDDGTGKCPRVIHENRLGTPEIKVTGVFA